MVHGWNPFKIQLIGKLLMRQLGNTLVQGIFNCQIYCDFIKICICMHNYIWFVVSSYPRYDRYMLEDG